MLKLFIANKNYSSWSLRPWLLLRELGIEFEEHVEPFAQVGSNWETFRRFSPTGKVPCLIDGDTIVWDSLAIAEYLAESNRDIWPDDRVTRAWARCVCAEMHSGFAALRNQCPMTCGQRIDLARPSAELGRDVDRIAELWNEGLRRFGGPFLAGSRFGAVDAFFGPVAFRVQSYGLGLDGLAMDYAARLLALAPMQDWYKAAIAETWRDIGHEKEIAAAGTVVADFRASA